MPRTMIKHYGRIALDLAIGLIILNLILDAAEMWANFTLPRQLINNPLGALKNLTGNG